MLEKSSCLVIKMTIFDHNIDLHWFTSVEHDRINNKSNICFLSLHASIGSLSEPIKSHEKDHSYLIRTEIKIIYAQNSLLKA